MSHRRYCVWLVSKSFIRVCMYKINHYLEHQQKVWISRNSFTNQVPIEGIRTLRPAPRSEFQGGSYSGSQIGWGDHICKVCQVMWKRILEYLLLQITLTYFKLQNSTFNHLKLHKITLNCSWVARTYLNSP